jgi:hypothetical protein
MLTIARGALQLVFFGSAPSVPTRILRGGADAIMTRDGTTISEYGLHRGIRLHTSRRTATTHPRSVTTQVRQLGH